jgi:hypothetical protein
VYNLLVQFQPWDPSVGAVNRGRIFEHTDDSIKTKFVSGDRPSFDKLIQFPCLFMEEGIHNEIARVGNIFNAKELGGIVSIEYAFDNAIPGILNKDIYRKMIEFGITNDFEFSRTHWAVKDVDIFRILLRDFSVRRQRPRVFKIPDHEDIETALVSVMMPFDAAFSRVYKSVKLAADGAGLRSRRADEIWENPAIIQDIVSLIDRSRVVICDCTGKNPNVFYEIGIAHTLGREVVLITQNDYDVPFDLRHLRYVRYLNNAQGRKELTEQLQKRLETLMEA